MSTNRRSSVSTVVRFAAALFLGLSFLAFSAAGTSAANTSFVDSVHAFFGLETSSARVEMENKDPNAAAENSILDPLVVRDAAIGTASSPTDYFRTRNFGGVWGDTATWESSPDGINNWTAATLSPTSTANTITILNGHQVEVSLDVSVDQVSVGQSALLYIDSGVVLTVNNGTGTDITVVSGGDIWNFGTITNNGQVQIDGRLRDGGAFTNAGQLQINGNLDMIGGSLSAAPSYGASSTLQYSFTDPTNRGAEWTPGATSQPGYPANVALFSAGVFSLAGGVTDQPFQISGNLTIFSGTQFDMTGLTKPLTVLGNILNGDTITLSDVDGGDLKVGGNFTNNGTFVPRSRSVTLNGSTGQTISGTTTFYDLIKSVPSAQTLKFAGGSTTTVTNWLILSGTSGNLLSLRSTSTGAQWNLVAGAIKTASFVDVQDSNNTGTTITPSSSVDSGNNAGWAFPHTLTVSISGSGSVASDSPAISCPSACSANLVGTVSLTATPSANNHFVNWTGSVTSSSNPVNVTMNVAKSVTANFAIDTHTVTFNANGGTGSVSPQTRNYNSAANLTANSFTRSGYTFSGWNTAANGTGTVYADQASYDFTADLTLYAQWAAVNHTVTFNANGGTGSMADQVNNLPANLTANAFTRAGYTFDHWNTAANNSGTSYNNGASYPFDANVTLYAQWAVDNHTVTFNANGGSGSMADQVNNLPANLNANAFTRSGYDFANWATAANGSGTTYADQASYSFAANATLYAQWTVQAAPTISKAFATSNIVAGGNTNLTVTIGNPNTGAITLTSGLTDTFPAGMIINTAGNTGTCPGVTATAGADSFTLANGTSIPGGGCTVIVNVTRTTLGSATNTIAAGALQTTAGNNASGTSASLTVYNPPTVAKIFGAAAISPGDTTTLSLTLANPATNPGGFTSARVDDTFPSGLTLANTTFNFTPAACGTVTKIDNTASAGGDNNVRFNTSSLLAGTSCQVVMNVTKATAGAVTNTTNAPTAVVGSSTLTGTAASASLSVDQPLITYTPIPNTVSTSSAVLIVTAIDSSPVTAVTIFSKVDNGSFNAGVACTGPTTGTATNGTWTCTIAGPLTSPSAISYYVTGTDGTNTTTNPSAGASSPNLFTIGTAPVPAGTYTNLALGDGASLGGNVIVNGNLNLGGVVTTGSNTLELGCNTAVTGAGGGNYVIGNVKMNFCGTGTFSFPVGTVADNLRPDVRFGMLVERPENGARLLAPPPEYTPMSMTVNGGTFPASITVTVVDASLAGLDPAKSVSRSWDVTQTGGPINADMTFNYLDPLDVNGAEADYRVFKRESGASIEVTPNSIDTVGNAATVTGVTSFSGWGVGLLYPTAASVSISGRVLTADGRGITNAMVTINSNNMPQQIAAITGPGGFYRLDELEAGQTYVITVNSKRFRFATPSRIVSLVDDIAGYDFVALP